MRKVLLCVLSLALFAGIGIAGETDDTKINPAVEKFNTAITFYASFDQHGTADLSNGEGKPIGNMEGLKYTKGT